MFLKVTDLAAAIGVDEKTVLGWIKHKGLPAHKQDDRYRINRVDLLEWATSHGILIPPEIFAASGETPDRPLVSDALAHGGIFYDLPGDTPESALREVVSRLKLPPSLDPEFLLQTLLAREALGSTALGNGIAIPHVRNPIVGQAGESAISLCFLKNPIDFDAIDGQPVTILFTLVTPNVKAHLNLLAKLAFLLRDQPFQELLHRPGSEGEIMVAIRALEETIIRK
ncbi:MAG: PTS sugar transporter subunit IIA [Desulfuromonadaceae bacterium]|nr:PTS sugar transporter subunit IIA [Desulfuromonadaceae bacterium]MDD2848687.1 PTS sugar transporter subunit IIA [Desulfuromonadaceae bacterium]MDD4130810.1 PTS sugar transporter subunit IIA [Desulfuromonadaceae bacterium]